MCGRFSLAISKRDIERSLMDSFALTDSVLLQLPRYNIAPRQKINALIYDGEQILLREFVWGFIPSFGINEWEPTDQGKIPYRITLKEHDVFYFAGVYSQYSVLGNHLPTCAVVTKEATDLMKGIHKRMPVMMDTKEAHQYLLEGILNEDMCIRDQQLLIYPVSKLVNNVNIDKPECMDKETPIRLEF
jgi:putative SOS response-associated peptidase YedK